MSKVYTTMEAWQLRDGARYTNYTDSLREVFPVLGWFDKDGQTYLGVPWEGGEVDGEVVFLSLCHLIGRTVYVRREPCRGVTEEMIAHAHEFLSLGHRPMATKVS